MATAGTEQLKCQLAALSMKERAELAQFLLQTLDDEDQEDSEDVAAAWREEISRRVAELDAGQVEGIDAEVMFAEWRARRGS